MALGPLFTAFSGFCEVLLVEFDESEGRMILNLIVSCLLGTSTSSWLISSLLIGAILVTDRSIVVCFLLSDGDVVTDETMFSLGLK